jgi:hypothetical protein
LIVGGTILSLIALIEIIASIAPRPQQVSCHGFCRAYMKIFDSPNTVFTALTSAISPIE